MNRDRSLVSEEHMRWILDQLWSASTSQLSHRQIEELVSDLPRLTEENLTLTGHRDSFCPICFTPFLALLAEEEMALAMDSPAQSSDNLGVTQTGQCSHVFCRRDISKWIIDGHDSCPICRCLFIPTSTTDSQAEPEMISPNALQELQGFIPVFDDRLNAFVRSLTSDESTTNEEQNHDNYTGMYS